jgi:hypothetical protein
LLLLLAVVGVIAVQVHRHYLCSSCFEGKSPSRYYCCAQWRSHQLNLRGREEYCLDLRLWEAVEHEGGGGRV